MLGGYSTDPKKYLSWTGSACTYCLKVGGGVSPTAIFAWGNLEEHDMMTGNGRHRNTSTGTLVGGNVAACLCDNLKLKRVFMS